MAEQHRDFSGDSAEQSRRQGVRKHIFVVNGSPTFLELMRQLLQDERYNVTTTNYVPETFDVAVALQPDLIIADLVFDQDDGPKLLAALEAGGITSEIPVIVVSTDRRVLERAATMAVPGKQVRYLSKPVDLEDVVRWVRELIGDAEA